MQQSLNKKSNIWIHAQAPDEDEIKLLCTEYKLSERIVRDALDRDEIPRVEATGNHSHTYVITRFAYQSPTGAIKTSPILFALNEKRLVTVSLESLPSIADIMPEDMRTNEGSDSAHLMLLILLKIDADYDRFIHDSSKQIRHLFDRLGERQVGIKTFLGFVHIEDDLNNFLRSLRPTNTTLRHLLTSQHAPMFERHSDQVNTVILNNEQSIQACEDNLMALDSIRRTYSLVNSHNLDRTIKILTMVSVFISIPTMFFSLYGMNIGLPFQREERAFTWLLVFCFFTVISAYLIGRKKRIF